MDGGGEERGVERGEAFGGTWAFWYKIRGSPCISCVLMLTTSFITLSCSSHVHIDRLPGR